jgi:hypothetical protein
METMIAFNGLYAPWGEMHTVDGRWDGFVLTPLGEEEVGEEVGSWRVEGVPLVAETREAWPGEERISRFVKRVMPNDASFSLVARDRLLELGGRVVFVTNSRLMAAWERILALPLSEKEKYDMFCTLCTLPDEDVERWIEGMGEST